MNLEEIKKTAIRLGENVKQLRPRYAFSQLDARIFKEPRIKLLKGFRGSGKTTLLLQLFNKYKERAVYFSVDSPAIVGESLYKLIKEFVFNGYDLILIDEVHKYPHWRRDVKAIYDEFPNVTLVCSGSAPLAFVPERREEAISLEPMSFKEFLDLKYGKKIESNEWLDPEKSMEIVASNSPFLEAKFNEYLQVGGYPICLSYDMESSKKALYASIRKSIYEDTTSILKMSGEKAYALDRILIFLATSEPGELSINTLATITELSKSVIYELLDALEKMEIIRILRPYGRGAKLVRGSVKILFHHPNLRYAICNELSIAPSIGALREELAVFSLFSRGYKVYTIKGRRKSPDYYVEGIGVVEIGGKGKSRKQLKEHEKGIVVKPDQLITLALF